MSEYEIVKHIPETAKAAGAVAATVPFTAIVKRMLGPAADEVAEMWKDQIRMYRYERQIKCVEKAERMAEEAGFTPKAVPPKILFPLLEGASLEHDETLHTMWAALLANAASDMPSIVRPSFFTILREMASDEAELLNAFPDYEADRESSIEELRKVSTRVRKHPPSHLDSIKEPLKEGLRSKFRALVGENLRGSDARFSTCIQAPETAGLILKGSSSYEDEDGDLQVYMPHRLTGRGIMFLRAVNPPKP